MNDVQRYIQLSLESLGITSFYIGSDPPGDFVHFDHGVYVPMEFLEGIKTNFPTKKITVHGFIDDTGFGVSVQ